MTISLEQLKQLATLAHLNIAPEITPKLTNDINAIFEFVEVLRNVDTRDVQPMMHPIDAIQPLRHDEAIPCGLNEALGKIAPKFNDNLYWVPKVIQSS
jgi:aspartyl-tRNA(Asn)/glutamyl-tRNA(Gln) amidotransferase subunit C